MLTDKQKETFQKLKDGKLTTSEKADFFYRLSGILKKDLKGLKDLSLLLDEIPEGNLKKINMLDSVTSAMELTKKLIQKLNPPQIRQKSYPVVGRKIEFEAVKLFDLGSLNQKYYFKDASGTEQEVKTWGYSFSRGLTQDEERFYHDISWYIHDLRNLLLPRREILNNCTFEDFLHEVISPLIEDAKRKGVSHQVMVDNLGIVPDLDGLELITQQVQKDEKEES
jgi:hypothetical protein